MLAPIHCLCNAYLGCTYPCYYVALQLAVIANTFNGLTGTAPSSRDKLCPDSASQVGNCKTGGEGG